MAKGALEDLKEKMKIQRETDMEKAREAEKKEFGIFILRSTVLKMEFILFKREHEDLLFKYISCKCLTSLRSRFNPDIIPSQQCFLG